MRISSTYARLAVLISAALLVQPVFATNVHRSPTSGHIAASTRANGKSSSHRTGKGKSRSRRQRGQQAIEPERVTQIQQALIREHYFTGDADGKWDADTIAAMQHYQADHGWQTKLMPDSRALKSLGLGPDYSSAINANGSSFAAPSATGTTPSDQTAGFISASGAHQ